MLYLCIATHIYAGVCCRHKLSTRGLVHPGYSSHVFGKVFSLHGSTEDSTSSLMWRSSTAAILKSFMLYCPTLFIVHLESTSVKIVCNGTCWSIISLLAALSFPLPWHLVSQDVGVEITGRTGCLALSLGFKGRCPCWEHPHSRLCVVQSLSSNNVSHLVISVLLIMYFMKPGRLLNPGHELGHHT